MQTDDLDAVRTIVDTLSPFTESERERILRWVVEKLGVPPTTVQSIAPARHSQAETPETTEREELTTEGEDKTPREAAPGARIDIRSFVQEKQPANDQQFATVVAYFYQFEAPDEIRKDSISGQDLTDACRLAGRARLAKPRTTLNNAVTSGLLDRPGEPGLFSISTVGENLVALTLPGAVDGARTRTPKRVAVATKKSTSKKKSSGKKKSVAKRATSKKSKAKAKAKAKVAGEKKDR